MELSGKKPSSEAYPRYNRQQVFYKHQLKYPLQYHFLICCSAPFLVLALHKAVVLDGSKNIATIGSIGCGAITSTGIIGTTGGISGSSTLQVVGASYFGNTVAVTSSVTAGTSFIIGSADMSEADKERALEMYDNPAFTTEKKYLAYIDFKESTKKKDKT